MFPFVSLVKSVALNRDVNTLSGREELKMVTSDRAANSCGIYYAEIDLVIMFSVVNSTEIRVVMP